MFSVDFRVGGLGFRRFRVYIGEGAGRQTSVLIFRV